MSQAAKIAAARTVLARAEMRAGIGDAAGGGWPVPSALSGVVPPLRAGLVNVVGSLSVVLALAGSASREGAWVAFVGMPWIGWEAARTHGISFERLAHIPTPRGRDADVLAALEDGFDVIVTGNIRINMRDERVLHQRGRQRGTTIIGTAWQTAKNVITARVDTATGYDAGVGHLEEVRLTVQCGGVSVPCRITERGLLPGPELVAVP